MKKLFLFLLAVIVANPVFTQEKNIEFLNPSFEDFSNKSKLPFNWYHCGFPGESTPDIQPNSAFEVTKEAWHGKSYLGLVVRDNHTWESVSQRLGLPMLKDSCYQFEIYLALSPIYLSISRTSDTLTNYITPVKLKVWGGIGICNKQQLLGMTKLVTNTDWKPYLFEFTPKENYGYIILEACYDETTLAPYNGNILLDKLSEIKPVPCN